MGTPIGDLVTKEQVSLDYFQRKKVAVDAFNALYQFLTILRSPDGALLTDRRGNVTSHLNGLFSRVINLMTKGIDLVFVFDGEPPKLKAEERERRREQKHIAKEKYEKAKQQKNTQAMYKFAMRTTVITPQIIDDAKRLLDLLGIPHVQAPSEGEAQACHMQKMGLVDFVASQDYDSLLFGTEKLVRYLAVSPRRKKANALHYDRMHPEIITLSKVLASLSLTREQLVALGLLVGTDFNRKGIKGIGPKKGLKLVQSHGSNFSALFADAGWDESFSWQEVMDIFLSMPAVDASLSWGIPNKDGLKHFLCTERDFSAERIDRELKKLDEVKEQKKQKGLGEFF